MYIVTATKDILEEDGVKVVGVFDSKERAEEAKFMVEKWMEENEFLDYEIYIHFTEVNHIAWYEIDENI